MSTVIGLPVGRLISVAVFLTPVGVATPNFNTMLILGSSGIINPVERMRTYDDLGEVSADHGTSTPVYLAAQAWFDQKPTPTSVCIGRWVSTASHGHTYGGTLSAANLLISAWTPITAGSFHVVIDGVGHDITGLNFSGQTNLNGVASVIQAALQAIGSGGYTAATFNWMDVANSNPNGFNLSSGTTGPSSTTSFMTTAGSGTDISGMLAMLASSPGAFLVNGLAIESALTAVTILDQLYSSQWYGLTVLTALDSDVEAIAPYIEGAPITLHYYFVNTQEPTVLNPADTTNLAYVLQQTGYDHTAIQYSSTSLYAMCSFAGRILTTQWQNENSAITLMYKVEPGIAPETITSNQAVAVAGFNCNVYVNYNNGAAIIEYGVATSGQFVDSVIGVDWLSSNIQTALFNALYTTPTKIPQTDAGMHILNTAIAGVCQQGVNNALLAPGTWNAPGFGQLQEGDFISQGFYVYQPPISTQSEADRAARKSVPFQVAAKLGGAVHTVSCTINVNP